MTVWVLHQPLTAEEDATIESRQELVLPLGDAPDMAKFANAQELKQWLQSHLPDDPPETINSRVNQLWNLYSNLHVEDVIAVPLKSLQQLAVSEVAGPYQYHQGVHVVPVMWHTKRVPMRSLHKHKDIFAPGRESMYEVGNVEARTIIRDRLPHRYNRFAKWKWLLILFFILNAIRFLHRMDGQP